MPQRVNVLSNANRSIGEYASNSAQIPLDCGAVEGDITMTDATRTDTANRLAWSIQIAPTQFGTYVSVHDDGWQGGTIVDKQGNTIGRPSRVAVGCQPEWRGQWVKMLVQVLDPMRFAVDAVVYTQAEIEG